jgi:tetratricopeptide (TPR) repeat protein
VGLLVLTVVSVTAGVVGGAIRVAAAGRVASVTHEAVARATRRDADVAFFRRRVARDPIGAADRARLAALYLQRARETADFEDYRRAERLARRSLALRVGHNENTYALLANALLAQHRFTEAYAAARALDQRAPGVASHRALRAEIALELGRYGEARALFDSLWPARHELAVAPRLARWAELTGRPEVAQRLLAAALAEAESRRDLPPEQLAWFNLRVGDLALRTGRLDEAEFAFRRGLAVFPNDYRLLAGLARLEAARGRWRGVIEYGDSAVAFVPDPATFGLISDAYGRLGDTRAAAEYAHAMEIAVLGQPGQWHRAWSLFLLDRDRRVPDVLAWVQEEIRARRDVYGYDLLGWALHKAHRDAEARAAMDHALALGTLDAQLFWHASAIAHALGDEAAARRYLERTRAANPAYHAAQESP